MGKLSTIYKVPWTIETQTKVTCLPLVFTEQYLLLLALACPSYKAALRPFLIVLVYPFFYIISYSNYIIRTLYFGEQENKRMDKETFLTRRWNYIITLAQGLPTLAFMVYGLATPLGDTRTGMIVLSAAGALF